MERPAYAYLLHCQDGTLYAGWTYDPDARLHAHNRGVGAKYTRSRRPVRFGYLEQCGDKRSAMRREAALKKLSRVEKLSLCAAWQREHPNPSGTF